MQQRAQAIPEEPIALVGAAFALLAALAWLASPGICIALLCYGAVLVSEQIHLRFHARHAAYAELIGIAGVWLVVLLFCALALPSNFSTALI